MYKSTFVGSEKGVNWGRLHWWGEGQRSSRRREGFVGPNALFGVLSCRLSGEWNIKVEIPTSDMLAVYGGTWWDYVTASVLFCLYLIVSIPYGYWLWLWLWPFVCARLCTWDVKSCHNYCCTYVRRIFILLLLVVDELMCSENELSDLLIVRSCICNGNILSEFLSFVWNCSII
jgi:hypothetical protein